jgi:hypothetical protein
VVKSKLLSWRGVEKRTGVAGSERTVGWLWTYVVCSEVISESIAGIGAENSQVSNGNEFPQLKQFD